MRWILKNTHRAKVLFIISIVSCSFLLIVWNVCSSIYPFKMQRENHEYESRWHELSNEEMKAISEEMNRRRTRISSICRSNGLNIHDIVKIVKLRKVVQSIFLDRKYNIAWCPTYKVSSSAWMEIFSTLSGEITPVMRLKLYLGTLRYLDIAKKAYLKEKDVFRVLEDLVNATRFMIVRHPLERLLSAYRDKLEHSERNQYYYKRYGRTIVRLYRNKSVHSDKLEPTFKEFLSYVVDLRHNEEDEHWKPYTASCAPCDLDYHYILKTESLNTEESFLIAKLRLQSVFPSKVSRRNINPKGHTGPKVIQEYYSSIPKSLIYQVFHHYKDDFKLFNYTIYDYIELGV